VPSRGHARRLPLASAMPQQTRGALPGPIVDRGQSAWLPRGSTFSTAHSRGVANRGQSTVGLWHGVRPGRITLGGYSPTFPPASSLNPTARPTLAQGLRRLTGHEVSHAIIAGPCPLMGHGLPCPARVVAALGQRALGKALSGRLTAPGKLCRLQRRPRYIRVAMCARARPFALAVADLRPVHTAARGGRGPPRGQAADGPGCQRERVGQARAEALHGKQRLVSWRVLETLRKSLVSCFDRLLQTVPYHAATGDCQHLGLLRQPAREVLRRPLLKPFAAEACPRITRPEVVHTAHSGGVLTDHMHAWASQSADCPCRRGITIPFGQDRQSPHVRSPACIGMSSGIRQATSRLHRSGGRQLSPIGCLPQPVDSPVPVGGRCDDQARHLRVIRSSLLQDRAQLVGSSLPGEHLVLLSNEHDHPVVCVQINPAVS
jgi:hypothetical protein